MRGSIVKNQSAILIVVLVAAAVASIAITGLLANYTQSLKTVGGNETSGTNTIELSPETPIFGWSPLPVSCPLVSPPVFSQQVVGVSGFASQIVASNKSSTEILPEPYGPLINFVLPPGGTGLIHYKLMYIETKSGTLKVNNSLIIELLNNTSSYKYKNINTIGNEGLTAYFSPGSEYAMQKNSTYNVTLTLHISPTATLNTYIINLLPAQCDSPSVAFLLTIGHAPYNGTLPQIIRPA